MNASALEHLAEAAADAADSLHAQEFRQTGNSSMLALAPSPRRPASNNSNVTTARCYRSTNVRYGNDSATPRYASDDGVNWWSTRGVPKRLEA